MSRDTSNLQRSAVMNCTCHHSYQDAHYGKGKRVHSRRVKDRKPLGWRCSVCNTLKPEK